MSISCLARRTPRVGARTPSRDTAYRPRITPVESRSLRHCGVTEPLLTAVQVAELLAELQENWDRPRRHEPLQRSDPLHYTGGTGTPGPAPPRPSRQPEARIRLHRRRRAVTAASAERRLDGRQHQEGLAYRVRRRPRLTQRPRVYFLLIHRIAALASRSAARPPGWGLGRSQGCDEGVENDLPDVFGCDVCVG